jgi:NADH-quinone oxidoreductase subunit A
MPVDYLPIFILIVGTFVFAGVALLVPYIAGPKNPNKVKNDTYESGKLPYGDARRQVPIHYYKAAMLFMMFDIEVIFFFPWAMSLKPLRDAGYGLYGLGVMGVFFFIFILGFIYEWKKGALEWV